MGRKTVRSAGKGVLLVLMILSFGVFALPVRADAPVLTVNSPTGTVFVASFPSLQQLNLTLKHSQLSDLNVLEVFVDGVSLTGAIGNPFDNANACKSPNMNVTSTCVTNGLDEATFTVPWTVPGPKTYTVTASVKHQGVQGDVSETVTFALIAVEYPAPPAIANAFINATYGPKAGAKTRGCVINQIAEHHAKFERYGPKGGPYNNNLVHSDVTTLWPRCQ